MSASAPTVKFIQRGGLPMHVSRLIHYVDGSKTVVFNSGHATKCTPSQPVKFRTRDTVTKRYSGTVSAIRRVCLTTTGAVRILLSSGETREFPVRMAHNGIRSPEPTLRSIINDIRREFASHDIRGAWHGTRLISNLHGLDGEAPFQLRRGEALNEFVLYYDDGRIVCATAASPDLLCFEDGTQWTR